MNKNLGKIEKIDLQTIFVDEPKGFTPWLEKNVSQLSEIVGIEIGDLRREVGVGDFNADLIGTEENTDDKIVIENQFVATDHSHLGKLITYAAGIGAKYIIWIAENLREDHKQALEWLNENTQSDLSFFGVEVQAIKIGNSEPALDFRVVVEPNEWSREIKKTSNQIDERHQKYEQFFTRLVSEYEKIKPDWSHLTPKPYSWIGFGAGRAGFGFNWSFRGNNRFAVELYIDTKDKNEVKNYFGELFKFKNDIDSKIAGLSWEELPEKRASRIAVYYLIPESIKNLNNNQVNDLIGWGIEKMDLFKKTFSEYIKKLN